MVAEHGQAVASPSAPADPVWTNTMATYWPMVTGTFPASRTVVKVPAESPPRFSTSTMFNVSPAASLPQVPVANTQFPLACLVRLGAVSITTWLGSVPEVLVRKLTDWRVPVSGAMSIWPTPALVGQGVTLQAGVPVLGHPAPQLAVL